MRMIHNIETVSIIFPYLSHVVVISASSFFLIDFPRACDIAKAVHTTNAEELDSPAPLGILPSTSTFNPDRVFVSMPPVNVSSMPILFF